MPEPGHQSAKRLANQSGRAAEALVELILMACGWTLIAQNIRLGGVEIDRIFQDQDTLVFVEVKCRKPASGFMVTDAITPRQQKRIQKAIDVYVADNQWDGDVRVDLVTVEVIPGELIISRHENWLYFDDAPQ